MDGWLAGLTDDELAVLAARGDDGAFDVLYRRYRPRLRQYAARVLADDDAADDAVQDALLRAWQGLGRRSQQTGFKEWLFAVARNATLDALNRRRPRVEVSTDLCELAGRGLDLDQQVSVRLQIENLWDDARWLPERQRDALMLHEVCGLSFDQISSLRGGTSKAACQAASDGRKGLVVAAAGRDSACCDVRGVLAASDRRGRRKGWVVAHLRACVACRSLESPVPDRAASGSC
jgi:RNA polymerase sigma-70 factor (ECF subfamily)